LPSGYSRRPPLLRVCWPPGLYDDNDFVTAGWAGNDLVTLVIAIPLLFGALLMATRGSARGELVWLGSLAYIGYNFAFYLFGASLNRLFLTYVAICRRGA
jgi:hypothetical protein